jgi:hypothetical protein
MNRADIQALRNPLFVLAAVALLGALAVYYSGRLMVAARQQLAQQQVQLKEARTRLQRSGEEKDIIVRYIDGFRRLERSGFVGDEQRINWLDGLRLANQQADLFGVDYQIGAQRPYAYASEFSPAPLALNESGMRIRFRLLHEGDLARFLDSLARQDTGIFTVDQCQLRRIDTGGVIRYQPNVSADCELSWITVKVGGGGAQSKP